MKCPRRSEDQGPWTLEKGDDVWRTDGTCSYCGSISAEAFIAAVEDGTEVGPTDKNYKAYVGRDRKFYFQHLTDEQQKKFIQLYNDKKMKIGFPGRFYVRPFFCGVVTPDA